MVTHFQIRSAFALSLVLFATVVVSAKTAARSPAENYVLQKLTIGEIADLGEQFKDNEGDRTLSASFLEGLLMNSAKFNIHRNGVLIKGARIVGLLNLANTDITPFVYLPDCEFEDAHFFQTSFQKGLTIDGAIFKGRANFSYATVMEGLSANKAKFTNANEIARFNNLKVKGTASFVEAHFFGLVTFLYAVIEGPFYVVDTKFLCTENEPKPCGDDEISFNTMKVNNGFFAGSATFDRPVNLINLSVADNFEADKSTFNKKAVFSMMSVGHNVFLNEATFRDTVWFINTNVAETIALNKAKFIGDSTPQFENAKAGALNIDQTEFKKPPNLSGLTYQSIYPTSGVLELIKASRSDYSAYMQLERFLQSNGYTSQADEVFIEMKIYERRKGMSWFGVRSYLSQVLQGFGRQPQRVLYFDFVFILIGALVFARRKMALKSDALMSNKGFQPQNSDRLPPYNRFLYSLTAFAPAIDTQYTNNWKPARAYRTTRRYLKVHKFLGYILVPLTIAIWTGIFK